MNLSCDRPVVSEVQFLGFYSLSEHCRGLNFWLRWTSDCLIKMPKTLPSLPKPQLLQVDLINSTCLLFTLLIPVEACKAVVIFSTRSFCIVGLNFVDPV